MKKKEKVEIFLVFPNEMGILNQKNLWPTLFTSLNIYYIGLGHPTGQILSQRIREKFDVHKLYFLIKTEFEILLSVYQKG